MTGENVGNTSIYTLPDFYGLNILLHRYFLLIISLDRYFIVF